MESRRKFTSRLLKGSLAVGVLISLPNGYGSIVSMQTYAIEPIPDRHYPRSFLNYISYARFTSTAEAVASVRDSRLAYRVVLL
jgi:hypothetical protein